MPFSGGTSGAHDDSMHQGSAKRDIVGGVAGLNLAGALLGLDRQIITPVDIGNDIYLIDRISGNAMWRVHLVSGNETQLYIRDGGAWIEVIHHNMRDVVNGIAALDAGGHVLAPGYRFTAARGAAEQITIRERTSDERVFRWIRIGVNDYEARVNVGGVEKVVQHEGMKDVASGIAGLDGSVKITSRLVYEDVANGVPTLNANNRILQSKLPTPVWGTGTDIYHQYTAEEAVTGTTYEKKFTLTLGHLPDANLKIAWDQRGGGAGGAPTGLIYRNGGAVGSAKSTGTGVTWLEQTDTIAGWSKGDTIELWGKNLPGVDYAWFRNLRILYDDGTDPITNS